MTALTHGVLPKNLPAVAVIMAGGSGTRFWPLSRTAYPKQFLRLSSESPSLIQITSQRLEPLVSERGVMVVTGKSMVPLAQEHLPHAVVLAEPQPRNTAACIGYAAVFIREHVGDVPMICVPADHLIRGEEGLHRVLQHGIDLVKNDDLLITIGITPTHPETGYGYIERGEAFSGPSGVEVLAYRVRRFVEKPDLLTAEEYLANGHYLWNSGMFIWRPDAILNAIERFLPELSAGLREIAVAIRKGKGDAVIEATFAKLESVSIDLGVMERAQNTVVLPASGFSWSDIGSWDAWVDCLDDTANERQNIGEKNAIFIDSDRVAVLGNKKLVACVGVKDLIVVDTEDALLVCHRSEAQGVKKVVDLLRKQGRRDLL